MTRLTKGLLVTTLIVVAAAGGGIAALYLLPVSIALGPCLKDWTNLTSYRPRESPLENASLHVVGGEIKICYGSPAARGRIVFGSLVPYGRYWRLGANEPTRLFTNVPLEIAGIAVPPGRYSLYVIPERDRWQLAISRSRFHWGTDFSNRVISREVGRATVPAVQARPFVEALTILLTPGETPERVKLMIAWEHTKVEVPIVVKEKREEGKGNRGGKGSGKWMDLGPVRAHSPSLSPALFPPLSPFPFSLFPLPFYLLAYTVVFPSLPNSRTS